MWNLYAGPNEAVAVTTTFERLRGVILFFSYLTPVQYIDFAADDFDDDQPANRLIHKRKEYASEQEVRAVVIDMRCLSPGPVPGLGDHPQFKAIDAASQPGGLNCSVDLTALVDEVIISPKAGDWFKAVVDNLVGAADLTAPVVRSKMQGHPEF